MIVAKSNSRGILIGFYIGLAITFILGFSGLVDWTIQYSNSAQSNDSAESMRLKTILCFLSVSIASFAIIKAFNKVAISILSLTLLFSIISLLHYTSSLNSGINELLGGVLKQSNAIILVSLPPAVAVSFLLFSLSLIIYVRKPTQELSFDIVSGAMSIALAISIVTLLNYYIGNNAIGGWSLSTTSVLQTAIGLFIFSAAWLLFIVDMRRFDQSFAFKGPILLGGLLLVVTMLFTNALSNQKISTDNATQIVFWFGMLFTCSAVGLFYFVQRSKNQAKDLLIESKSKDAFEAELERSHLTLKLATDVAKLGIWTWDVDSGELHWNARMFDIYNTPDSVRESGLLYEYWYESVHPEDRDRASNGLQNAVNQKTDWHEEFRLLFSDGTIKYIKASANCIEDPTTQKMMVYGGNIEITKEKELQDKLGVKTKLAQQSSIAKSQFLANMSHEIRTPMNGILGMGDLLTTTSLNMKQSEYIDIMMMSATKLLHLLNDILDLSKIEAGEMTLETICVPFEELVGDTLKALATEAHNKGLDYHYIKESSVPNWIYIDPVRFTQILTNLVSNAIKFTEQGEVLISISSKEINTDETLITVEVKDTGIGLSTEQVESMFNPFHQADETITRKYGGSGLGLSIVRQLIEMFKGSIDVDSNLGEGTSVRLSIPMKIGKRDELTNSQNIDYEFYADNEGKGLNDINCLVIDSNDINRKWLNDMLHSWRCNVKTCSNATEGLEAVQSSLTGTRHFNAVIIDRGVPDKDAFECISQIKEICQASNIPMPVNIIVMTSSNLEDSITQSDKANIHHNLIKPLKQSEVFNVLMTALGKKENLGSKSKKIQKVNQCEQLNVLVAEDHQVNQFLIREILEKRGHQVTIVENGRLALESIERSKYDAIVMDVQMPVMDGLTATKLIRNGQHQSDIYILGLTAKALKEDKFICLEAGMNSYLSKPTNPDELISVLENMGHGLGKTTASDRASQVLAGDQNFEILDIAQCKLTTANDMTILRKMLELAYTNIPPGIVQIQSAQKDKNWYELARAVHKNKGMLSNFCVKGLVADMENLIENAEHVDTDPTAAAGNNELNQMVDSVIRRIEKFNQELQSYLKSIPEELN